MLMKMRNALTDMNSKERELITINTLKISMYKERSAKLDLIYVNIKQ